MLATLLAVLGVSPSRAVRSSLGDANLAAVALSVGVGGVWRVDGVALDAAKPAGTLELERFRVLAPGAIVVVRSSRGAATLQLQERAYYKGGLAGVAGSLAVVSVAARGGLRGWVTADDGWFLIASAPGGRPSVERVERTPGVGASAAASSCAATQLDDLVLPAPVPAETAPTTGGEYAVDLAIETDWEYFDLFGSAQAAAAYATDLVASASAIYDRDVATLLQISHMTLWSSPSDPWTVEGDLLAALQELGDYWHANHQATERTTTHLLSGKTSLGGGIAYGGVLCSPDIFTNGHWAGGYGLSGSMTAFGTFRDVFIFSHELGHNFDSRHTHCYNGVPLPGDPPIDRCFSGDVTGSGHVCYAGPTDLPPDGGSIMSYCHLLPGGYGNLELWLGREGSYGESSERVPAKMLQHVQAVATCLPARPPLFADGFESGDTSAWSATIP